MVIGPGVYEVSGEDIPRILEEATRQGVPAFTLSTAARTDQEAFFTTVRAALPLDPPLQAVRLVWEALADSLWGGLHALNAPRVVIVWPDARPVAGAQGDFAIALDILREMVTTLAEAQYTGGPTHISVYIAPATTALPSSSRGAGVVPGDGSIGIRGHRRGPHHSPTLRRALDHACPPVSTEPRTVSQSSFPVPVTRLPRT